VWSFKPLREGASTDQIIHALHEQGTAYASLCVELTSRIPEMTKLYEELRDEVRAARTERLEHVEQVVGLRMDVAKLTTDVAIVTDRVNAMDAFLSRVASARMVAGGATPSPYEPQGPPLPPMRPELTSTHDFATAKEEGKQEAKAAVSDTFQKLASITPGPRNVVHETPEKLTELATAAIDATFDRKIDELEKKRAEKAEMARLQADALAWTAHQKSLAEAHDAAIAEDQRLEHEKREAEKRDAIDVKRRRRAWRYGVSATLFCAFVIALATYLWGKANGHIEERANAPAIVPQIVMVSSAPPSSATPPFPTSSPASVAPAGAPTNAAPRHP
jgi:hypothetical protein